MRITALALLFSLAPQLPHLRLTLSPTQLVNERRAGATGPYWLLPLKPSDVSPAKEDACALVRGRRADDTTMGSDVIIVTVLESCSLFARSQ